MVEPIDPILTPGEPDWERALKLRRGAGADRQGAIDTVRFRLVTAIVVVVALYPVFLMWPALGWLYIGVGVAALAYSLSGLCVWNSYQKREWRRICHVENEEPNP